MLKEKGVGPYIKCTGKNPKENRLGKQQENYSPFLLLNVQHVGYTQSHQRDLGILTNQNTKFFVLLRRVKSADNG
jgi:hypothetical protein